MKISLLCVLLLYTYLHMVIWFWNTLVGTWFELTMFFVTYRSSSLEPEGTPRSKSKPREHIIPIHVEQDADESSTVSSPPTAKPSIQGQRSVSHRYCSQTYANIQHSLTLLWGSSFMKVVSFFFFFILFNSMMFGIPYRSTVGYKYLL